ncbi:MAG: hypothetical protein V1845_03710 [bacterium]
MPGPITHLAYAERYLRKNPSRDLKKFILGTIFPDIRYIAKIERDLTHKKFRPDLNLSAIDSFKAGWKLHIYLDSQWNKIVKTSRFYCPGNKDNLLVWTAAKIIEDRIDRKKISDLAKYWRIIKNPGSGSVLHISKDKIKLYYQANANYLIRGDYEAFVKYIFQESSINPMLVKTEELEKDKKMVEFLSKILDKITP